MAFYLFMCVIVMVYFFRFSFAFNTLVLLIE